MSLLKIPVKNPLKSRRIPNAFMLYVKEQKKELVQKCPEENKNIIGAFLGKKWRSLRTDEKQVYYDKYNALRKLDFDNSVIRMRTEKQPEATNSSPLVEFSDINSSVVVEESNKVRRMCDEPASSDEPVSKKFKGEVVIASTSKKRPFGSLLKQKAKKKVRRPPNPYLLYAKEHRNSIPLSYLKEKKCHASTILGNMWRALPDADKTKYIEEAKRLHDLQVSESAISSVNIKFPKNRAKKSVGRPPKKNKEMIAAHIPVLRSMTNDNTEKDTEGSTSTVHHPPDLEIQVESNGNDGFPESQVSTDLTNISYQQTSSTRPQFHHLPPPIDSHQSKNCFCWNNLHHVHTDRKSNDVGMRQNPFHDGAMSRPCAGAGFVPPFFMPYPVSNAPFWMYHQMVQQMYLQNISQPYCCNYPYNYYRNNYFYPYLSTRNSNMHPNSFHPTCPATAGNSGNTDESAEARANEGNSDDELLVVDDYSDQRSFVGTDYQE